MLLTCKTPMLHKFLHLRLNPVMRKGCVLLNTAQEASLEYSEEQGMELNVTIYIYIYYIYIYINNNNTYSNIVCYVDIYNSTILCMVVLYIQV